jgi:hypothetical protein
MGFLPLPLKIFLSCGSQGEDLVEAECRAGPHAVVGTKPTFTAMSAGTGMVDALPPSPPADRDFPGSVAVAEMLMALYRSADGRVSPPVPDLRLMFRW